MIKPTVNCKFCPGNFTEFMMKGQSAQRRQRKIFQLLPMQSRKLGKWICNSKRPKKFERTVKPNGPEGRSEALDGAIKYRGEKNEQPCLESLDRIKQYLRFSLTFGLVSSQQERRTTGQVDKSYRSRTYNRYWSFAVHSVGCDWPLYPDTWGILHLVWE